MMDVNNASFGIKESSFRPKFYVIYMVIFSIYYFFSPIVSQLIFFFLKKNLSFNQTSFMYELFEKLFIPTFSVFLILIVYIFIIEERNINFLFQGNRKNLLNSNIKGIMFALVFLFALVFIFILKDFIISFKLNTEIIFSDLFKLILVFIFMYIKYLFLECLYRGWLLNILSYRYSLMPCILFTSVVPTVIAFIEYQRVGFYLLYIYLFNILITIIFLNYKDIFLVTSFNCCYNFLKRYILSIENMNIKLEPIFFTVINNKEVYNIENNIYSIVALCLFIGIVFLLYKMKLKL